jgi:hypothetical protein
LCPTSFDNFHLLCRAAASSLGLAGARFPIIGVVHSFMDRAVPAAARGIVAKLGVFKPDLAVRSYEARKNSAPFRLRDRLMLE